jgi:hypothetical protein
VFGDFRVDGDELRPNHERQVETGTDLATIGYALYSGRAVYRQPFHVERAMSLRSVSFDRLGDHAVVRVDGTDFGKVLWRPWRAEGKLRLSPGHHELEVEVWNTQGNQLYEYPYPWGLLGPVRLGFEA